MPVIPAWLLNILISLAIKVGVPYLVKLIPGLPQAVIDAINELLSNLKRPEVSNSASRKVAQAKVKEALRSSPKESDTIK